MKPMQIDFAAPGVRRALYRLHPALLLAGAGGIVLAAAAALLGVQAGQQQALREQAVQAMQRKQAAAARAPARQPETAIPEAQAAAVNGVILQLYPPAVLALPSTR